MGDRLFCQQTKKALLSISDGRASSFFNTFIKIITPHPFLREADFGCKDTKKNGENQRKMREKRRKSEKIREFKRKTEKNQRNSEKIGEIHRKTEKIGGLSVNFGISVRIICKFLAYP